MYLATTDEGLQELANYLVVKLNGDLLITTTRPISVSSYLQLDRDGLTIFYQNQSLYINALYNDFLLRLKVLNSELLIQALNMPRNSSVLDITAGFGRDALIMALYGYQVIMLEYNTLLAAILYYVLYINLFPSNMSVVYTNSFDFLETMPKYKPSVIYFDPMFESNNKSKAKKPMQFIQAITAADNFSDKEQLFNLALNKAAIKVVVKRDNKAPYINSEIVPNYSKQGKTIRYDIYITKR